MASLVHAAAIVAHAASARLATTSAARRSASTVVVGEGGGPTRGAVMAANVQVDSWNQLTAVMPPGTRAGTFFVYALTGPASSRPVAAGRFTYLVPVVDSLGTNRSGSFLGNTSVTIFGSNFTAGAEVEIGQGNARPVVARNVDVISPTEISALTPPARRTGTFGVYVVESGVSSRLDTNAMFTYLAPHLISVTPNAGEMAGGTFMTIDGTGFLSFVPMLSRADLSYLSIGVYIGQGSGLRTAVPATSVSLASPTQITAYTGVATRPGTFEVYVVIDGVVSTGRVLFTYTKPICVVPGEARGVSRMLCP